MSKFNVGDDVTVQFGGRSHAGEVMSVGRSGYVLCRITVDPAWDYGGISASLDPQQTVMVRENAVEAA